MDIDITTLKNKIAGQKYTNAAFAKALGIDESTLYRKIEKGGSGFSIKQVKKIVVLLNLTNKEACDIFLS
ncbi:MAG: helix-turn-helix transcriptional regulator [Oscillospiraceae bacterium]|nr:helix-turn-helix transcriptional regulator [Oscillospiraceae bacterium]